MNIWLKRLLCGLPMWIIPFLASMFVWDVQANAPSIPANWFNALMSLTWAIGFAIALYYYFKDVKKKVAHEPKVTGITWYVELCLLDLIFLVGVFGMPVHEYTSFLVMYLSVPILTMIIGKLKK